MIDQFENVGKSRSIFNSIPGRVPASSTDLEVFHLARMRHA